MPASAADQLVQAADRAGERTARSALDLAVKGFELPSSAGELSKDLGSRQQKLSENLDLGGALGRVESAGQDVLSSGDIIASQLKADELAKTPIADLDSEISRLTSMSFRVMPAMLARTDIEDFSVKMQLANKVQGQIQNEMNRVIGTRKNIKAGAEARAQIKADTLQAQADRMDKERLIAKDEFDSKLSLYKAGADNIEDIADLALKVRAMDDARNKASKDNPYFGAGDSGVWPPEIVSEFGEYEATGSPEVGKSPSFIAAFSRWVQAGRPGSSIVVKKKNPKHTDLEGGPFEFLEPEFIGERKDIREIWKEIAEVQILRITAQSGIPPRDDPPPPSNNNNPELDPATGKLAPRKGPLR